MSNIIAYRIAKKDIAARWQDTKRPAGMNSILYMHTRFPNWRDIIDMKDRLKEGEVCVIFDSNDSAREIYQKKQTVA